MAYSTIDDIKNQLDEVRLIQLTDDENTGAVVEERVTRAIADADEEIDGYVGARHAVPLATVPSIIRKLSVDIAINNLYARREKSSEIRETRYKNAIRFLKQVALGKISLGADDPEGSPPTSDAPELSSDNPARIFDRASMKDF